MNRKDNKENEQKPVDLFHIEDKSREIKTRKILTEEEVKNLAKKFNRPNGKLIDLFRKEREEEREKKRLEEITQSLEKKYKTAEENYKEKLIKKRKLVEEAEAKMIQQSIENLPANYPFDDPIYISFKKIPRCLSPISNSNNTDTSILNNILKTMPIPNKPIPDLLPTAPTVWSKERLYSYLSRNPQPPWRAEVWPVFKMLSKASGRMRTKIKLADGRVGRLTVWPNGEAKINF